MLLKKKIRKLKDSQKRNLSIQQESQIDPNIWNYNISNCFKAPNKNNILSFQNCSFNRYKQKLEENPRYKVNKKRNKICIYIIEPIKNKFFDKKYILQYLNTFYPNLEFIFYQHQLDLKPDIQKKQSVIQNQQDKSKNIQLKHYENTNNFRTSDLITQMYRTYTDQYKTSLQELNLDNINEGELHSIITFIDQPLLNPPSEDIITGLTAGINGSIISIHEMNSLREIISTTVHEIGHILHIGHCGNWYCLLNYGYEFGDYKEKGGCINFCPECLQKVQYQLGFNIEERYQNLLKITQDKDDQQWLQTMIQGLQQQKQIQLQQQQIKEKK